MMQRIRICISSRLTSKKTVSASQFTTLAKNQSEIARKVIEEKYGLVKAGSSPKHSLDSGLLKAVYGKSETKKTIDNIVGEVIRRYKFSSLTEFNAVLRQYNVVADRGKEGMVMFQKNGLLYSMLDAKGNKIGVPIKASGLLCKPTLKNLEEHFQRGTALKQDGKEQLINTVESFFRGHEHHTRASFCDYMTSQGINAMFRENKEGRVYGLTFIDNKSGAVLNGSDLGKAYSGQAIIKQFEVKATINVAEKESETVSHRLHQELDPQSQNFASTYGSNDLGRELFGLMKPTKSGDEGINPKLKQTKKKKRGISG